MESYKLLLWLAKYEHWWQLCVAFCLFGLTLKSAVEYQFSCQISECEITFHQLYCRPFKKPWMICIVVCILFVKTDFVKQFWFRAILQPMKKLQTVYRASSLSWLCYAERWNRNSLHVVRNSCQTQTLWQSHRSTTASCRHYCFFCGKYDAYFMTRCSDLDKLL